MCEQILNNKAVFSETMALSLSSSAPRGSRRRRLWELAKECHCPVIGVCLPLAALRQTVNKAIRCKSFADDYELHVGATSSCIARNHISEALQADLERRFAAHVRQFRAARDSAGIRQLWQQALSSGDIAGAFWAALTHPHCDAELEDSLCREMHMIQHQAGASARIDKNRLDAALAKDAGLLEAHKQQKDKYQQSLNEKNQELDRLRAEQQQLNHQLIGRQASLEQLQAELAGLKIQMPDLDSRQRLLEKLATMSERQKKQNDYIQQLEQQLAQQREQQPPPVSASAAAGRGAATLPSAPPGQAVQQVVAQPIRLYLKDKTVLCVGGRTGNLNEYRHVVEQVGARFMHHDGGLEDNVNLLESNLAGADMVICQTGCISHNAYWRVKDYCKRTGKRCVFVSNPSASSLSKSLQEQSSETL